MQSNGRYSPGLGLRVEGAQNCFSEGHAKRIKTHFSIQALRQQLATMESMCSSLQKKKQTIKGDLKDQLNDLYRRIDVLSAEKTSLLVRQRLIFFVNMSIRVILCCGRIVEALTIFIKHALNDPEICLVVRESLLTAKDCLLNAKDCMFKAFMHDKLVKPIDLFL